MSLTWERAKEMLKYDPETGLFYWRQDRGRMRAGDQAGCVNNSDGYVQIYVNQKRHAAHRLAVLIETGAWPVDQMDHINGIRNDNRWCNLRECTNAKNNQNRKMQSNNSSGFKGVFTATDGRTWFAQIQSDGKLRYLGSFSTKEEAAAAYDNAAMLLHGEFARLNEAA